MDRGGLKQQLLDMAEEDRKTRARLAGEGVLYDGYHPDMEEVHVRNAHTLKNIVELYGWPKKSEVGAEAADAAWKVLVHSISVPGLMRKCAPLFKAAAESGEASPLHFAILEDAICFHEGRPQTYGTIFDWDENGEMNPWKIEEPESVDERRESLGMPRLEEDIEKIRESVRGENGKPPEDFEERQRRMEAWRKKAGW